jgi:GNAT superfamily N-acetyltransferase
MDDVTLLAFQGPAAAKHLLATGLLSHPKAQGLPLDYEDVVRLLERGAIAIIGYDDVEPIGYAVVEPFYTGRGVTSLFVYQVVTTRPAREEWRRLFLETCDVLAERMGCTAIECVAPPSVARLLERYGFVSIGVRLRRTPLKPKGMT